VGEAHPFVTDFATCWIALGIIGFVIYQGQSSLNSYWELLRPGAPYRLTWLELSVLWIVAVAFLQTAFYVAGINYYIFTH